MARFFSWRNKKKKQKVEGPDPGEMSFFDHLEDLRWHLFRGTVAIVIAAIGLFVFREYIIDPVFRGPFRTDFPTYKFLCGLSEQFCFDEIPIQMIATSPYEQFMKAMVYAFFGGIMISFPYLLWELWRFIKPGLSRKETRMVRYNVFFSSLLFFTGVFFGYFVILPFSVQFLSTFELMGDIENMWRIGDVVNFILLLLIGTGALFQLPLFIFYLSKLGLVGPAFLKKYRRHAIVVILIIAALLTPPDPFSQVLIFLPLLLLYQIGIVISTRVYKKKALEEAQERAKNGN